MTKATAVAIGPWSMSVRSIRSPASIFAAALLGLPLLVGPGSWIPGVCAVIFTVLAVLLGFLADAWATGAVVGLFFGAAAALVCNELKLLWPPGFVLGFGFGLFAGRVNAAGLPLILPPLFSALFATAGAALLWAPHARGAQLAWLLEVDHALLACGACVAILVGVSLEREHQRKRRLARRTKRAQDDELARQLAARTQRYQRAFEQAKDVEVAEDERPPRRR